MRITRETDYALIVMTYMAQNEGAKSASTLADVCGLNLSLVSKALKLLVKAELLHSTRGVYGGYVLNRSPREISLMDVIEATEGPIAINACASRDNPCDKAQECNLAPHWHIINQNLYKSFSNISLQSLLEQPIKLERTLESRFSKDPVL